MATWDTAKYLCLFVSEATENLDAFGRDAVRLTADAPAELIDSLFRRAHSIKGMAASMGFAPTAQLAHRLEDVLAHLREAPTRIDRRVVDVLLGAGDALQTHVRALQGGQPVPDVAAAIAHVDALLNLPTAGTVALTGPAPSRFQVTVRVSPASTQPGVRGFLAYKRLASVGTVIDVKPSLDEVKAGRLAEGRVRFVVESAGSLDELKRTVATVADVELEDAQPFGDTVAPAVAPRKPDPEATAPRTDEGRTVRIRTEVLDQFLDAAGELLLATARVREAGKAVPEPFRPPLVDSVDRLHAVVRDLHDKVMAARMTPLSAVTDRLPRAARDIARSRGRDLKLSIDGADIELDRSIVEVLSDPLLHLLRNAVDHGIEPPEERRMRGKESQGTVTVAARRLRDRVQIDVADDGRGIDGERLKALVVERGLMTADAVKHLGEAETLLLVCLPGLSTAATVTDVSGRGVGMDSVKRMVESVGGSLDIQSSRGKGTRFRLVLPLTVAMARLLLVAVGPEVFGVPIARIAGVIEAARDSLPRSQQARVLHFGAGVVPVYELNVLLGVAAPSPLDVTVAPFVVVETDEGKVALGVDSLLGQEDVVLKALTAPLDLVAGLAGVTILGNGRPVFVLDPARLVTH